MLNSFYKLKTFFQIAIDKTKKRAKKHVFYLKNMS